MLGGCNFSIVEYRIDVPVSETKYKNLVNYALEKKGYSERFNYKREVVT